MQKSDFEKGREAYLLGDDEAIINATSEFMEGYHQEWSRSEGSKYSNFDGAFTAHCSNIYSEFRRRTPPPVRSRHQFIVNGLAGTAALLLFVGLIAACLLFENAEISAWMYGGAR